MSGKVLNVALLGYGYAGKTFHAPLVSSVDGLCLNMVISSDAEKVGKDWPRARVNAKPEDAFNSSDVDIVIVATPNDTHYDLASRALEAGKHVVVDKPFTTTAAEASALIKMSVKQERVLSGFHNRRWDADFLTLRRMLGEGHLGEVKHFESHYDRYRPQVRQRWRERPGPGGGLWYDLGPHLVDQALVLFGMPDSVFGDFAIQRQDATAVDYFHVLLRFGQTRVILHGSALVPADSPRFTVHGTRGSFVKYGLDVQEEALKRGESPKSVDWGVDPENGTLTTWNGDSRSTVSIPTNRGCYSSYYEAIRDAINLGTPNPVPREEVLAVMEVIESASTSASAGRELSMAART